MSPTARDDRPAQRGQPRARLGAARLGLLAAAALLIAAALAFQVVRLARERDAARAEAQQLGAVLAAERVELEAARREREAAERAQAELRVRSAALSGTIDLLTAPGTRSLELAPPAGAAAAGARARAFVTPVDGRLVLFCEGLPELAADRTYQAWVHAGAAPVPAGVFRPIGGRARHEVVALPVGDGGLTLSVTIEPSGGRPAPTGPTALSGRE